MAYSEASSRSDTCRCNIGNRSGGGIDCNNDAVAVGLATAFSAEFASLLSCPRPVLFARRLCSRSRAAWADSTASNSSARNVEDAVEAMVRENWRGKEGRALVARGSGATNEQKWHRSTAFAGLEIAKCSCEGPSTWNSDVHSAGSSPFNQ